jgi:hypothetical protein
MASPRLPQIITRLPGERVHQAAQRRNYVYAVPLDIERQDYEVFFMLQRAEKVPGIDLRLTVESAYPVDTPIPRPKRPNAIRFRVLVYNWYTTGIQGVSETAGPLRGSLKREGSPEGAFVSVSTSALRPCLAHAWTGNAGGEALFQPIRRFDGIDSAKTRKDKRLSPNFLRLFYWRAAGLPSLAAHPVWKRTADPSRVHAERQPPLREAFRFSSTRSFHFITVQIADPT